MSLSNPQPHISAVVLIVDDNPAKLAALEAALYGMDIEIVTATSGMEALHQLLARDFAVVLLDVNMPIMDGFETATMIRSRSSSEHLPIIFVTAEVLADESRIKGYELGAVDYILSPVLPQILRSKVATFADLYRLRERSRRQSEALANAALEIRQKAEQVTMLFENNADGIVVIDGDGRILKANPVAAQLFGQTVDALPGIDFGMPVVAGETAEIDIPGGAAKVVEMRCADIVWEGRPAQLATLRDITERKKAEDALKEHLDELRRWHDVTLVQGMRNIELKREVNELLKQAGQTPRYPGAEQSNEE